MTKKVLVVEDDPDVRELIQMMLEMEGYEVLLAGNGAEALQLLRPRRGEVGLILLDLLMPVMDGITFLEHKRAAPELASIPTVVVSASAPNSEALADTVGFLAKPVTSEALMSAVVAQLGSSPQPSV